MEQCIERSEQLAKLAFQPRPSSNIPFISWFLDFLVSYFADGRYPAENLEAALQETFGSERSMLDCSMATGTGTRIALPVTTIRDVSTCLFTNYNGIGSRPQGCGKRGVLTAISITYIGRISCPAPGSRLRTGTSVGDVGDIVV